MGHNISALIIKGDYDKEVSREYDLRGIDLGYNLNLFLIDNYYSSYWQHALEISNHLRISPLNGLLVPTEGAIAIIVEELKSAEAEYALIHTDYYGGQGGQYATILKGRECVAPNINTINDALIYLGVRKKEGVFDEFDSVNLGDYRQSPEYLDKYFNLCEELGL